ncbi:MAG: GNAT family N-acetyltransferase [Candidatus Heimdallarchaeota archaeon]
MFTVAENKRNFPSFDYWDFQVEFRINNGFRSFEFQSINQVFIGDYISLKSAIAQKTMLQCLIDIGEQNRGEFLIIGSVSLTWEPTKNECYIGNLWIEPDFRGNGLGTKLLNEIGTFADELGIVLTLHAKPFISPEKKPTPEDILELKDFYRRFGFREASNTKGMLISCAMKRIPSGRSHYRNN